MKKKAFMLCGVIFCTALVSLAACSAENKDPNSENNSEINTEKIESTANELFDKYSSIEEITVYSYKEGGSVSEGANNTIGEISGYEILYQTDQKEDIDHMISMFEGWDMKANKVDEKDILDMACSTYICFGDNVTLGFAGQIESLEADDGKYYGSVEYVPYYLPEEFGAFIADLEQK